MQPSSALTWSCPPLQWVGRLGGRVSAGWWHHHAGRPAARSPSPACKSVHVRVFPYIWGQVVGLTGAKYRGDHLLVICGICSNESFGTVTSSFSRCWLKCPSRQLFSKSLFLVYIISVDFFTTIFFLLRIIVRRDISPTAVYLRVKFPQIWRVTQKRWLPLMHHSCTLMITTQCKCMETGNGTSVSEVAWIQTPVQFVEADMYIKSTPEQKTLFIFAYEVWHTTEISSLWMNFARHRQCYSLGLTIRCRVKRIATVIKGSRVKLAIITNTIRSCLISWAHERTQLVS